MDGLSAGITIHLIVPIPINRSKAEIGAILVAPLRKYTQDKDSPNTNQSKQS